MLHTQGYSLTFQGFDQIFNDIVKLYRTTGMLQAPPHPGGLGRGKLSPYKNWFMTRLKEKGDLTLAELALELEDHFGVCVSRWGICRNYAYIWADGVYFQARTEPDNQ